MNEIKIKWIAVAYGRGPELDRFVNSVLANGAMQGFRVELDIVDNSPEPLDFPACQKGGAECGVRLNYYWPGDNLGYFGGARWRWQQLAAGARTQYHWLIVSNVDLLLPDQSLFLALQRELAEPQLGVLAPNVVSASSGEPQNPFMRNRPPRLKMVLHRMVEANWLLFNAYVLLRMLRVWLRHSRGMGSREQAELRREEIYAGHGSLLAIHHDLLDREDILDHPAFLYFEEISLAELVAKLGKQVVFTPDAKVLHFQHASTGQFKNPLVLRYIRQARKAIFNAHFR